MINLSILLNISKFTIFITKTKLPFYSNFSDFSDHLLTLMTFLQVTSFSVNRLNLPILLISTDMHGNFMFFVPIVSKFKLSL
jgi:hypothetical protein